MHMQWQRKHVETMLAIVVRSDVRQSNSYVYVHTWRTFANPINWSCIFSKVETTSERVRCVLLTATGVWC